MDIIKMILDIIVIILDVVVISMILKKWKDEKYCRPVELPDCFRKLFG